MILPSLTGVRNRRKQDQSSTFSAEFLLPFHTHRVPDSVSFLARTSLFLLIKIVPRNDSYLHLPSPPRKSNQETFVPSMPKGQFLIIAEVRTKLAGKIRRKELIFHTSVLSMKGRAPKVPLHSKWERRAGESGK
jgi:hypothetical protein